MEVGVGWVLVGRRVEFGMWGVGGMGKCGLGAGGRTGNMSVPALSDSPSVSLSRSASLTRHVSFLPFAAVYRRIRGT